METYKNHNYAVETIKNMLNSTFIKIAEFNDNGLLRVIYTDNHNSTVIETKETAVWNPYTKETWDDIEIKTGNIIDTDFFEDFEKSVKNPGNIDHMYNITSEGHKWMSINFPMSYKSITNALKH